MTNEVREAFATVLPVLQKHAVELIVVGGAAVGFHGHNRISGGRDASDTGVDLDFWYRPTNENYNNLVNALKDLGVDTSEMESTAFDPKKTFLKVPHKTFHTDFLPTLPGLGSFQESLRNSSVVKIAGCEVRFISYVDLIKNKESVNREIDRSDIAELRKKRKGRGL